MKNKTVERHAPGSKWRFDYLFNTDENTTMPELRAQHGNTVTVVRHLDPATEYDFEGDFMFEVTFPDGTIGQAWDFELAELEEVSA